MGIDTIFPQTYNVDMRTPEAQISDVSPYGQLDANVPQQNPRTNTERMLWNFCLPRQLILEGAAFENVTNMILVD